MTESRALIIGAFYVIMIVFITVFIAGFTNASFFGVFQATGAETSGTADFFFWFIGPDIIIVFTWIFLPCFLVALTKRFALNKHDLTIICTMALTSFLIPTYFSGIYSALSWFAGGYPLGEPYTRLLLRDGNPLLAPITPISYVGFWHGGTTVPWGTWAVPLAFWMLYFISQQLFALFLATALLRRTYIEIESLPFPMATGMVKTIDLATSKGSRSQMLRNKWLWLGMAIGFVGTTPYWLHFAIPTFGISLPWIDLTPFALLPWVPLVLVLEPYLIGGAYFIPLEVLFSTILFFVILYVIVPTVATTLGIFGPFSPGLRFMWGAYQPLNWGNPGSAGWINWGQYSYGYQSIWFGALLGFVIWPMFRMRKSIWESIKAIWSKTALEDGEPLPYRYSWLLAAFFFILHVFLISFAIGMGAYPLWWSSAFMILMTVVWVLGFSRVRGNVGGYPGFFGTVTNDYLKVVYYEWPIFGDNSPITPLIRGNATALQSTWITFFGAGPIYMSNIANVAPRILESYKIGKSTKTDSRSILIGAVIAVVLAVVLTPILYLLFSYHFGILEKYSMSGALSYTGNWIAAGAAATGGFEDLNWWLWFTGPPKWTVHVYEVVGFIAVVAIYLLRMRVVKLRMLHPVGLIMAIAAGPVVFFPWLVAFIAKWLTIKVGGVKLYEEKGMPFALGLIVAFCLMIFVCGLFWSISHAI